MSENNGLTALVAQTNASSQERRQELERRLKFGPNPRHNAGLASGLQQAADFLAEAWPEASRQIQELAAIAADCAEKEEQAYAELRKQFTPEFKAEMNDHIARLERGEIERVPAAEVLRSLQEIDRRHNEQNGSAAAS